MSAVTGPGRNRVDPYGDVVAIDLRGAWTGNRGILHRGDVDGLIDTREVVRHHTGIAWIVCVLEFRGRRIPQWAPRHYTPLFFHDEAVALAAGHRPCAECRRPAFSAFTRAVAPDGPPRARDLDRMLHTQRWQPRVGRRLHDRPWPELPDGTFVLHHQVPALVLGDALVEWTNGYRRARIRPRPGPAVVLTPPVTLAVLAAGYPVQIDATARTRAGQTRSSTDGSTSSTEA